MRNNKRAGRETARLQAPRGFFQALRAAERELAPLSRDALSPAAGWLTDNARQLRQKARALEKSVRRTEPLPALDGEPRVSVLAKKILSHEGVLRAEDILTESAAFEREHSPLSEAELCSLQDALCAACLKDVKTAALSCAGEAAAAREAARVFARVRKGNFSRLPNVCGTVEALKKMLDRAGDRRTLALLNAHLESRSLVPETNDPRETLRLLRLGVLSLRALERIRFDILTEKLSAVAGILSQDDTYLRMDRKSRALYRRSAARIARRFSASEEGVARAAVALSKNGTGIAREAGYYLLKAPNALGRSLGKTRRGDGNEKRRQTALIFALFLIFALSLSAGALLSFPWYVCLSGALCVSELIRLPLYAFSRRKFPARLLPRINMPRIPEDRRTLVVVPAVLPDKRQALQLVRHLSVLRSLSPDKNLDFMLLCDLKDAKARVEAADIDLMHAATDATLALNETYGNSFYLFVRERTYSKTEGRYIGRERKRGALETLLSLIAGDFPRDTFAVQTADPLSLKKKYAYVITLDQDTLLLPGDARRLIGTMEHPLQKGRVAVVQPAMRVSPMSVSTRAQRFLGGKSGVPAYALSAQDFYQDVFSRGSFVGKGIIDPVLFSGALKGRVREERVLSHDLLEGEIAGAALSGDIFFLDGHPKRLSGWYKRLNRWTRGDWQLFPYLFDRRLSPLSRFKMLDNLRRSLVPAASLLMLIFAAGRGPWPLFLLALPYPLKGMALRLWFLPAKAYTCLDGALRALYRMGVSKRHLLSWVTAAEAETEPSMPFAPALFQVLSGGVLLINALMPGAAAPFLAAVGLYFVLLPLFAPFFDGKKHGARPLDSARREEVLRLARDTWQFFEEFVNEKTRFLPPDNVQLEPDRAEAMRTSPTNIGLYLLSLTAAKTLGFIESETFALSVSRTVRTMEKLDKYEGHLYNWYDLKTLAPLEPRFVSSVDEGNLAACLLTCAQALRRETSGLDMSLRSLPSRLDRLFFSMRFELLYDRADGLFSIGLDPNTGRLTEGRYDLMASEALLLSYVTVMSGQAPATHFMRLGRPLTRAGGGPALLSWGGTMFEYLMPTLLLPLFNGTLLSSTCKNVVRAQRRYRPLRPFGVSESGYFAFDEQLNYQYRAFGLPALALAPDTSGDVVAPYASMLALPLFPRAAADNLIVLKRLGAYGALGLYEALDYSKKRSAMPPAVVKSHMAHHQGMILCAASNVLTDHALSAIFCSIPAADAFRYLLCEEAPRFARVLPPPLKPACLTACQDVSSFVEPDETDAQLLFSERMTWVTDALGNGFLKSGDCFLSRFDPFSEEGCGPRFYLRDVNTGRSVCLSAPEKAAFDTGDAVYEASCGALRVSQTRFVSPMEGAAVAWFTLVNTGAEPVRAELISYLEPALGSLSADLSHPNFRDLFITVEKVSGRALCAKRRERNPGDRAPLLLHYFEGAAEELGLQGDRALFLGRTGTLSAPDRLRLSLSEAPARLGGTVMPCLSLSAVMTLPPRGETRAAFVFCACADEAAADRALRFFDSPGDLKGALSLAKTQAELTRKALETASCPPGFAQRLLGRLLHAHPAPMPAPGREKLWAYSVSGDRPIILALVPANQDVKNVELLLRTHAFFALGGVIADLVFLCVKTEGYDSATLGSVRALASVSAAPRDALFILAREPESERVFRAAARVVIDLAQPLADALLPPAKAVKPPLLKGEPPALPDYTPLNSFGGFSGDRGFLVVRPAPRPWCNFLCTPRFGTLVCETGVLYSCLDNSRLRRLTKNPLSVLNPEPAETFGLIGETGALFPLVSGAALHEPGVTTYFAKSDSFSTELAVFTDDELPCGARVLTLRNEGDQTLTFRFTWRVLFHMGETPEATCVTDGPGYVKAVHPAFDGAAYAMAPGAEAQNGALSLMLTVKPMHQASAVYLLCFAQEEKERRQIQSVMLDNGAGSRLRRVRFSWDEKLSRLFVRIGSDETQRLINTFLPCQTRASRLYMRAGLYQAGGAFGFRDQLQDMLTFLLTDPSLVRSHLLLCAAHQYEKGDVQHWWHAPRTGVRTRISDDLLFLPYIAALYVVTTGDEGILSERAPYLVSEPLNAGEDDRYETPALSSDEDTLLSHCLRAVDAVRFGAHGLPLMGGGDWNDGMNGVGGEAGESVWLAFFFCVTLERFAPFSGCEERLDALRRRVLNATRAAWTGQWYLRAWYSDGRPLGGPDTQPPRIDLISQCFSVFAGAPQDNARRAVDAALDKLWDKKTGILKLLDPPFEPTEGAGYIGAYLPGVRENGGQYTHAVPWMILALARLGRMADAWALFFDCLPASHANTDEKARRYLVEPYVLSADVYAGENTGRGGWTWYTGSAAWLYYAFYTGLMGVVKTGDKLRFSPSLPDTLDECAVVYRYGESTYELIADRETRRATLDGERLENGYIPLVNDGRTHTYRCGVNR